MKKNVAGQFVNAQVLALNGTPFTGTVTVFVTGDNGTQTIGSVGSGICTHEGRGLHSYAPAQAETNFDNVVFTFEGTGAITTSIEVWPGFPQTGDSFARIGAAGAGLTDLATQLSINTIDDLLDSEIAALTSSMASAHTKLDTIDDFIDTELAAVLAAVDTEIAAIFNRIGAPVGDSISADIAAGGGGGGAVGVSVEMLGYIGDCKPGGSINFWYFTKKDGVPTALAGSPVISVYKDDSTTPITAGITHAESINDVVGLNRGTIDFAADGEAYSANSNFVAIISTGTVGALTAVGQPIVGFSLFARSFLRATNPDATIEVDLDGFVTSLGGYTPGEIADEIQGRTIARVAIVDIVNDIGATVGTKIWNVGSRTLTAVDNIVTAVWNYLSRTLTSGTSSLTNEQAAQLTAIAASILNPSGVKRNTAVNNFVFRMVNLQGLPVDGLTIVAQRKLDGGVFANCANTATGLGARGLYAINLAATDDNGEIVTLVFSAPAASPPVQDRIITIITEP